MKLVIAGLSAALLAACTGNSSGFSPSMPASLGQQIATPQSGSHEMTFNYTGARQKFTVPTGVAQVTVKAWGASGSGIAYQGYGYAGGGFVNAAIPVTPGESLAIFVGGAGRYNGGSGS